MVTEFDSFATDLIEESKALLAKAKKAESFSQSTYLHASLLLSFSALEAFLNTIIEEILIEPYNNGFSIHEQALLLEKEVRFEKGCFALGNGLKISRMTDRVEFLYKKYSKKTLDGSTQWYSDLKNSIDLRNKLVHPKEQLQITVNQVENANMAVINTINELYLAVYKRKFPAYGWGITSKETLL